MFKREKKAGGYRDGGRILLIPVGDILPNPDQPRREFDQTALRELAQSIAENGLINPLAVSLRDGVPVLVAGERRLRALRMLGWSEAPCVAVSEEQGGQNAVRTLIENMQRVDMNCFEEAEGIGRLIREYGLTQEEAADRLGYSQSAIANKLRLLRLPGSMRQRMVSAGLTERHARALLRLPDDAQREWTLDRICRDRLNVAQTDRLVEAVCRGDPPRRRPTWIVRDVRLFINTIRHAVEVMQQAGIGATMERRETGESVEYVVRIPAACFGVRGTPDAAEKRSAG